MRKISASEICHGCGNCVTTCPLNVSRSLHALGGKGPILEDVILRIERGVLKMVDPRLCDGCRLCLEVCPTKAIEEVLHIRARIRQLWLRARRRYIDL